MDQVPPRVPVFSYDYVIEATLQHMRTAIDRSIKKTILRIPVHAGDPEVSMEILTTLSSLHQIRAQLDLLKEIPCKTLQLPSFLPRP
jgi:hypothetical protein